MKVKNNKMVVSEDLLKQREYQRKLQEDGFDFGLVFANAFVRGMRDIGYKSTATALHELIDNSIQAEADNVHVLLGYNPDNKSQKKPDKLAVIDNGHGMDPLMIRASVLWGGTHRENDRTGFGRYGYGMPSACVSIGQQYSVYSLVSDGDGWHNVTIDLEAISRDEYRNHNGHVIAPEPKAGDPPEWVMQYIKEHFGNSQHGTVVIIDKIDRLTYSTTQNLRDFFFQQFGITYRNFIRQVKLHVDGKLVEPIDPLFITEGFRFYDVDEDRAEALEPHMIEVKDRDKKEIAGIIKVRYSYMPPTFLRTPEDKLKGGGNKLNERFPIRKDNNGVIVLRAGRQIDVVNSKCPWTTFQNNDRYIGVEVDFPPVLDEDFSITTSKQQIVIKQRIWDILENNGVYDAISQMRKRYLKESAAIKAEPVKAEEEKRPSEHAMEEAQVLAPISPTPETPEQKKTGQDKLNREADKRSKQTGVPAEDIIRQLIAEAQGRPFKVEFIDHPGAPFYRMEQIGGQKVLYINRAHRFYSEIYVASYSTPHSRAGLETLLFVMGDCELKANPEIKLFYERERGLWSNYLNTALDKLSKWENTNDNMAADLEAAEAEQAEKERQASVAAEAN